MHYRQLGRTGLRISALILGCASFGGIGSVPELIGRGESEQTAFAIMDAAWELGITCFDTADAYAGGQSEAMIGAWLKARGSAVRDQLVLASKVFNPVGSGPNDRGLSRRHVLRQIDASLRRLGTDYLDLYLIHEPDPSTPQEETLRALDDLVHQGKVRYLGASNMPAWRLMQALWLSDRHGLYRFEWVQNEYHLLRQVDQDDVLPVCQEYQLGYTPFSPLAGGWLTGKYRAGQDFPAGSRMSLRPGPYQSLLHERTFVALDRFRSYAHERGTDMAALALAWIMAQPLITAPIIGPRAPSQLDLATQALAIQLT